MKGTSLILVTIAGLLLALTGCTSKTTKPKQYSGFLSNYSDLKETKSASGQTVMRWTADNFKISDYQHVIYTPIVYYPTPHPTTQIGQKTLDQILDYTNMRMKNSIAQRLPLTTTPAPHTLIFRGAITAVDTSKQGLHFYEVIPVAMLIAGTQAVTGHRTLDSALYFEGELIDASTRQVVMRVVRKGTGKNLANSKQQLTLNDLKPVVDGLATDASLFDVK